MNEARNQILEQHGFENRDLAVLDFDFLRENVQLAVQKEMAENRRISKMERAADESFSKSSVREQLSKTQKQTPGEKHSHKKHKNPER